MHYKHVLFDGVMKSNYVEKGHQNWMQRIYYLVELEYLVLALEGDYQV